jgi:hypothetical protein
VEAAARVDEAAARKPRIVPEVRAILGFPGPLGGIAATSSMERKRQPIEG